MPEDDANRLRRHAEDVLGGAYDPSRVLPILHRLAKRAEVGSDDELFAHVRLAELLVGKSPWRASIHARKVLALHPMEGRAWAILGLSQALLGNYKFAQAAYHRAVCAAPTNPFYAHNLGHLIDVALSAPGAALPWLIRAHELAPGHVDIVTSLAHALARTGDFARARELLSPFRRLSRQSPKSELSRLVRWIEREAPGDHSHRDHRDHRDHREGPTAPSPRGRLSSAPSPRRRHALATESQGGRVSGVKGPARKKAVADLPDTLALGLSHLPLSAKQVARARALAKDVRALGIPELAQPVAALAAAIAYAIVFVDQVPLSAAEVAAPFRVGATRLRAAFEILRTELDLTRGDARYATGRR